MESYDIYISNHIQNEVTPPKVTSIFPSNMKNIRIEESVAKALLLDIQLSKEKKKKVAKENKMKWEVYKAIRKEYYRRKENGLNLVTG